MSISFLFGIHCHQPVDNFSEVVDEAIEKSYKPFFKLLRDYRDIKVAVHYSGWLLEYIKDKSPELFGYMQEASANNSIEFFSGGYYEPILASIPKDDRVGQIKKLNSFIKKHFNQKPKGLWLTERVWDDSIIADIKEAGIEYVIVDDYHFLCSGFKKDSLHGYYLSESGGESIKIFPIDKELRYKIPFDSIENISNYFNSKSDNDALILFDDGEKFGIWPTTYHHVYENGWLRAFFEFLTHHTKVQSQHFYEYVENHKPKGIAYLPTVSYFEMGEWSLDYESGVEYESDMKLLEEHNLENKFLKGSIWKNFLVKYPQSNHIQKRFLELSKYKKDAKHTRVFEDKLYRSQTNDVLWHGVFGGLYLPNLRDNAYRYIIDCENILESSEFIIDDFNLDGVLEAKISNDKLITIFEEKLGSLIEFDIRDCSFNLQNTISRKKELYHKKIVEHIEDINPIDSNVATIHHQNMPKNIEELKKLIKYDEYEKYSFIDHLVDRDLDIDNFLGGNLPIESGFSIIKSGKKIHLENQSIQKEFWLKDSVLNFKVLVNEEIEKDYCVEFNLHFAIYDLLLINGEKIVSTLEFSNIDRLEIKDPYTKKSVDFIFKAVANKVFIGKIETISKSENGFDRTVQGISIGFKFSVKKVDGAINIGGYLV